MIRFSLPPPVLTIAILFYCDLVPFLSSIQDDVNCIIVRPKARSVLYELAQRTTGFQDEETFFTPEDVLFAGCIRLSETISSQSVSDWENREIESVGC